MIIIKLSRWTRDYKKKETMELEVSVMSVTMDKIRQLQENNDMAMFTEWSIEEIVNSFEDKEIITKDDEKAVLAEIRRLISLLGKDSYIATAFEGVLEIAEDNIRNDFACSMKQKVDIAERECKQGQEKVNGLAMDLAIATKKIEKLERDLERELEWRPYTFTKGISDDEYERLKSSCHTSMTDAEVTEFIHKEYGFVKEQVKILYEKPVYQINRHGQLRQVGVTERKPYYYASDMNHVRFEVCGVKYEVFDGTLFM